MLSNNADEFVSGFRLRVIAVLGSDECAPRTARSTSSGALLLGAVVPEPVVVLVSLPCRSWSALKMEDMQSGLRFDGKPRGRRRTPPSHDWIFVPRPCRRASHTGSQAFAHATDEVPETRAINHACRIPKLKYIGTVRVGTHSTPIGRSDLRTSERKPFPGPFPRPSPKPLQTAMRLGRGAVSLV